MTDDSLGQYVTHQQLDGKLQTLSDSIARLEAKVSKPPNWLAIIGTCLSLLGVSITATSLIAGLLWFVFMQEIGPIKEDVQRTSDIVQSWTGNRYTEADGERDRAASKERDSEMMRLLERNIDATDTRLTRIEGKIAGWEVGQ